MSALFCDIKLGLRILAKQPGLTCFIVLTLAIGIGANTALFSMIYAVLLRPMPFPESDRLMMVGTLWTRTGHKYPAVVSPPDFKDWQEQNSTFESMAAWYPEQFTLTGRDKPVALEGLLVSGNFLKTLRRPPLLGRDFTEADTQGGQNRSVLLGHTVWRERFASDPDVVGQAIALDGRPCTVIGVVDADMGLFEERADFLIPMPDGMFTNTGRDNHFISVFARLKPGVSIEQGRADMTTITERLAQQYADINKHKRSLVVPIRDMFTQDFRTAFWVLYGAVATLLLLACVNIANLLLARANRRQQEMTVRLALGAGRWRLMRQVLIESLLLALLGGALGVCLARGGLDIIVRFASDLGRFSSLSTFGQIEISLPCLLVALAATCLCALLSGVIPAWHACRVNLNDVLKRSGRSHATGKAHHRSTGMLVIGEVALATILLTGAGLLFNSFQRVSRVDPGFEVEDILAVRLDLPGTGRYDSTPKRAGFYRELLSRVRALPGAAGAATVNNPPMGYNCNSLQFTVEGRPPLPATERPVAFYHQVSDHYFRTMQIPLKQGRAFNKADLDRDNLVVIVDEALVRKHFPNENPLGKRIHVRGRSKEIVGVVGEVHNRSLVSEPVKPMLYEPLDQDCWTAQTVVCRTTTDPLALAGAVRQAVLSLDSDLPVLKIETVKRVVFKTVSMERLSSLLMILMAGVAFILAITGIYAVVAHSASERINEIGVRMALGAQKQNILTMMLKKGLVCTVLGLGVGVLGALLVTRCLSALLYQISATDPVTFVVVPMALLLTAMLACYIPARRAAKTDPMVALRYE